jgi:hypothetical protein
MNQLCLNTDTRLTISVLHVFTSSGFVSPALEHLKYV